jgi:alcohol dehydrogenase class IV
MSFAILQPPRILFGRGDLAKAPALIHDFGQRVLIVHGASGRHVPRLTQELAELGAVVQRLACDGEPTLAMLEQALAQVQGSDPQVVVGIGGGAVLDMAKALAALIPAPQGPMAHLEVVGQGLRLDAPPLPFVALPTTAGTGAEVTKNAVIGLPDLPENRGRKISLRDDRMIARVAIIDPALTDHCPRNVTLASGLDAVTQVIEPYLSCKATPYTDAIARPAIAPGLAALRQLMKAEDAAARDALAWTSLSGGLALANGGLGAVHGLAGVIGGMTGAAHGAICGALLGPVLAMNRRIIPAEAGMRIDEVCAMIAAVLGGTANAAPARLAGWARAQGLPGLQEQGLRVADHPTVVTAALSASSMKGNPVVPTAEDLLMVLAAS